MSDLRTGLVEAVHVCEDCGDTVQKHDERCYFGCRHFPALCCPDCWCGSFHEAHPHDECVEEL